MSAESSPATARVFFALWPEPELSGQLGEIADNMAARFGGRATRRETVHLTLAFLAKVPEARLPELIALARQIRGEAFALTLDRLGYWPRQHLLWAACEEVPAALKHLAENLRAALRAAGFAVDAAHGRNFIPHLTLVRKLSRPPDALPEIAPLAWPCSRFVLVRSQLSPTGPDYLRLAEFDPGDRKTATNARENANSLPDLR